MRDGRAAVLSVAVRDPSAIGLVRREAARIGVRIGLGEEPLSRLALVCTEASENLLHHGGGGEVLLGTRRTDAGPALELIALDRGPGIADVPAALVDGHSGAGTSGHGLGALRRQSDAFDLHSAPGLGTAVLARVRARGASAGGAPAPVPLEVGAVRVARRGERHCGDAWRARVDRDGCALCLVDGLGHGAEAAEAARAAIAAFDGAGAGAGAADRLHAMHEASRATRGTVGAVLVGTFAPGAREAVLEHAGVGNVGAATCLPGRRPARLYAVDGTLGRGDPVVRPGRVALAGRALLIVHSDGVRPPASLEVRGGLARRDPTLVAAVLYRDGADRGDDCAVLVARLAGAALGASAGVAPEVGPPGTAPPGAA